MAHLKLNPSLLATLNNKVVVLTGGATGIGRATVKLFHRVSPSLPLHPLSLHKISPFPLPSPKI